MGVEEPKLKRRVLGYSTRAVKQVLADRSRTSHETVEEARKTRALLEETREELSRVRADLTHRTEEAASARDRIEELEVELEALGQRLTEETDLYRKNEGRVEVLLAEIDAGTATSGRSQERATQAEARAAQLEERLATIERHTAEVEAEKQEAHDRLSASRRAAAEAEQRTSMLMEELESLRDHAAERDEVAEKAAREALGHRAEADRLQREVVLLRGEVERLRGESEKHDATIGSVHSSSPRAEEGAPVTPSEEIGAAIHVAEEAMARILDSGRQRAAEEFAELEQRSEDLARETEEFDERRSRIEAAAADVGPAVGEARSRITQVEDMLETLVRALGSLEDRLARLNDATPDAEQPSASDPTQASKEETGEGDKRQEGPAGWLPVVHDGNG